MPQTILIVDDTPANLGVLVETLGGAGYQLMVAEDGEEALATVERDLVALCEDRASASELVAERLGSRAPWASRRTPDVPTQIVFDERTSPHHTIIEVFTKDRPGLRFRLARALEESGLVIALSKINTEGTKVADVFYVQELDGRKVEGKKRLEDIHARLSAAITTPQKT